MAGKPRIIMFHEALAKDMNAASGGAFEVIAPRPGEDRMAWLASHGPGIQVLVTLGIDKVDAAVLDCIPDLRLIQVFGAGFDKVDLGEVARRGVTLANAGDTHAGEVADFAVTMMLGARRELLTADRWVRDDQWKDKWMPLTRSLSGARVGIVGLGNIGQAIAQRVEPFCPDIAWWGPRPKPDVRWPRRDTLLDLAQWADILMVAAFAHDETRGLVTREVIDALGPDGLIVNISRGFVVDEDALIDALRGGRLGQAALDVFATEPTPAARWRDVPNVVLAPHCAGSTVNTHAMLKDYTVGRLRAWFELGE